MRRTRMRRAVVGLTCASLNVLAAQIAHAEQFNLDGGWQGYWKTTLSSGTSWRAGNPDSGFYTAADGARIGLANGSAGAVADAGNLNYRKGDVISSTMTVVSDLKLERDDMGGLVRFKAWDDLAASYGSARYGNQANNYATNSRLSDDGMDASQRFKNAELLDAYVYNTFSIDDHPLQVRLGKQVINWGESLFFQGVNQINPLDLPALRRPASQIKDGLVPVWAAYGNLGLGGGVSAEGFYQLTWDQTSVDSCGTYWSTIDTNIGSYAGACNKIIAPQNLSTMSASQAADQGYYAPVINGRDGRNSGQFGAALKIPVDSIDTEFGLYGMNVNSRVPIVSTRTGTWGAQNPAIAKAILGNTLNPIMIAQMNQAAVGVSDVQSAAAYWEYPNNVQFYGVSTATNLAGWSVGTELSFSPNLPVQRNGDDMINGIVNGSGPLSGAYRSAGNLSDVPGYDRLRKYQFQVNGIKEYGGILGASQTTLMGETMLQWNNAPNYKGGTSVRYGRAFIFGVGSSAGNNTCNGSNPNSAGCQNDGYVTDFAWGYRLSGALQYPQFMGTALKFVPQLSLAHDVQGVSADGQLNQDRVQVGLNARFSYDERYSVDFGYVYYAPWAKYDPLRDHDFYSLGLSMTF